jgi:ribonuclease HI
LHNSDFLFAFVDPVGVESSYFAELSGALRAIEIAFEKNWLNVWLESDSSLVVNAFKNPSNGCLAFKKQMEECFVYDEPNELYCYTYL